MYPEDLYEIYAVPNNCSDDTAGAAKRAGAKVIDVKVPVKVKADALQYTFQPLQELHL